MYVEMDGQRQCKETVKIICLYLPFFRGLRYIEYNYQIVGGINYEWLFFTFQQQEKIP